MLRTGIKSCHTKVLKTEKHCAEFSDYAGKDKTATLTFPLPISVT
jgi:hypothetical protein